MTYASREASVESGQPVELFQFVIGAVTSRYTSAEDEITFGGNTYFPRQITRTDPQQSNDERRQQIEVTLPTDDEIAARFIGIVPGELMTLTITRFHRGDSEAFILWSGKIMGAAYTKQGAMCTLRGVTTESSLARPIPHFKYQGLCNHVLFDTSCLVDKDDFKFTGMVQSASGNTITVPGIDSLGATWAVGGYISSNETDFRLITHQNGDILTIMLPFHSSPVGLTVDVFAGCDHTLATCETKFSNELNYGGFPFVPTLNPFKSGI